ncbi:MAG: TetR/AcrR family transcriptional regulator [Proteobacteria bacterium]|nr:TetR/AcrR family transcriptional regulator [Pseudomonadota bacterium]
MAKPKARRKAAWEEMMKQSIYEAAVSVIKAHGLEGLRMDRVAQAAEVATGTLYIYFKDKEDLLNYVIENLVEPLLHSLIEIRDSRLTPLDKLEAYFRLSFQVWYGQEDLITIIVTTPTLPSAVKIGGYSDLEVHRSISGIIAEIIEEGVRSGVFRSCPSLRAAYLIHGGVSTLIKAKAGGYDPSRDIELDVADCLALFLPGLLNPGAE